MTTATRITLIDYPTTEDEVKANRAAFTAVLRDPDTQQVRGPFIAYTEETGGKVGGCLLGTFSMATEGYYLTPQDPDRYDFLADATGCTEGYCYHNDRPVPAITTPYAGVLTQRAVIAFGLPYSLLADMVYRNDTGADTFPQFADEIDAAPITLAY